MPILEILKLLVEILKLTHATAVALRDDQRFSEIGERILKTIDESQTPQ